MQRFLSFVLLMAVASLAPCASATGMHFLRTWGAEGAEPGKFNMPIGVAVDASDELVVTDHYNDRVQRFSGEGEVRACFPTLPAPSGIAISADGTYVISHFAATAGDADKALPGPCISVYSPEGKLLRQWGKQGKGDGEFDCPGGIAISGDGRIYVADQTNHRVQVFDAEGKFLFQWGEYGTAEGQFGGGDAAYARTGGPQFIAIDPQGNVWTTEGMGCRVQQFSADGKFLRSWGDSGDKAGGLGGFFSWPSGKQGRLQGPIGICIDKNGKVWVSAVSGRVQQYTPEGVLLQCVSQGQGDAPGTFYIPHGLALDSQGRLFVADTLNHRIQVFGED